MEKKKENKKSTTKKKTTTVTKKQNSTKKPVTKKKQTTSRKSGTKKKTAFTLIELLSVIIILGVLMVVAIPSVTRVISDSRKASYVATVNNIIDGARTKVNEGTLPVFDPSTTYYLPYDMIKTETGGIRTPYGEIEQGYVVVTYNEDGYDYYYTGIDSANIGIYITSSDAIDKSKIETDMDGFTTDVAICGKENIVIFDANGNVVETKEAVTCINPGESYVKPIINKCTFDGTLSQGAEYVNGQYTYRYKQQGTYNNWENITNDGWGVKLTNPDSTDEINTPLCTSINGKPIVSMTYMFYASKAQVIDFSSFNTSNVVNMKNMFAGRIKAKTLDLSTFDTSKVTDMSNMFAYDQATTVLNISSFRTGNVTNMYSMFAALSEVKELDLSHFDTSKVTSMGSMFYTTRVTTLDVSSFDTSNVTSMRNMFNTYMGERIIFGPNFKTHNVTSMEQMFFRATNIKTLDLSTFDTTKVTSMYGMFQETLLDEYDLSSFDMTNVTSRGSMFSTTSYRPRTVQTPGYARTEADAAKLNSGTGAGSLLVFTVRR